MNKGESDNEPGRSRPRRRRLIILGAAVVVIAGAFGIYRLGVRRVRLGPVRHVILISLDTTRKDHFGCYDNKWIRTPRVDALADESIVFSDYMTVVPSTLASHTSLFTGKYPHSHGTPRNGFTVNLDNVMLPEVLETAGFRTVGFIGSFALASRFDFSQGFEHYDETFDRLIARPNEFEYQDQRSARSVTDAVIRHLDQSGVPDNLFLFVHYFDPHTSYAPPAPYDTLYGGSDATGRTAPDLNAVRRDLAKTGARATPGARALASSYAGEISYMDEHLGRLLDYLKTREILEESILIVTSDHGENFWEHPYYFDHGLTLYQTTTSAVCLIRMPGASRGGTRVDRLVASVDVLPTLLEYLDLPIPSGVDGEAIDLSGVGAETEPFMRFGEATKPAKETIEKNGRWHNSLKSRCVRQGDLKYIQTPYAGTEELYNLSVDPHEQENLLINPTRMTAARAAVLREELEAWSQSANPLPSRFESSQLEDTIRRLRALGYTGP